MKMKRSEMTRAVQLEIHKRLGSHNIDTKKIAEKVLDKVLELGMLPPESVIEYFQQDFPNASPNLKKNIVNQWEPEDELP